MHIRLRCLSVLLLVLTGCGGGGPSLSQLRLSGVWVGTLVQAGLDCSDDFFVGAGFGSPVKELSMSITGGDRLKEKAIAEIDSCTYSGLREEEERILFESDDRVDCYKSVEIWQINDGSARIFLDSYPAEPGEGGERNCVLDLGGDITLQS